MKSFVFVFSIIIGIILTASMRKRWRDLIKSLENDLIILNNIF